MIDRIIDFLIRLIPGSRNNPDSLEGRFRRATGRYERVIAKEATLEATRVASVRADAERAEKASVAAAQAHLQRAERLQQIAR